MQLTATRSLRNLTCCLTLTTLLSVSSSVVLSQESELCIKCAQNIGTLKSRVDQCSYWPQQKAFLCLRNLKDVTVVQNHVETWEVIPLTIENAHWFAVCGPRVIIGLQRTELYRSPHDNGIRNGVQILSADLSLSDVIELPKELNYVVYPAPVQDKNGTLDLFFVNQMIDLRKSPIESLIEPGILRIADGRADVLLTGECQAMDAEAGGVSTFCMLDNEIVSVGPYAGANSRTFAVNLNTMTIIARTGGPVRGDKTIDLTSITDAEFATANDDQTVAVFVSQEHLWKVNTKTHSIREFDAGNLEAASVIGETENVLVAGYGVGVFSGRKERDVNVDHKLRSSYQWQYQSCATSSDGRYGLCGGIAGELTIVEFDRR